MSWHGFTPKTRALLKLGGRRIDIVLRFFSHVCLFSRSMHGRFRPLVSGEEIPTPSAVGPATRCCVPTFLGRALRVVVARGCSKPNEPNGLSHVRKTVVFGLGLGPGGVVSRSSWSMYCRRRDLERR